MVLPVQGLRVTILSFPKTYWFIPSLPFVSVVAVFFTSGKLSIGNNNLVLASSGSVSGYNQNNYIVAEGTGFFTRQVANTSTLFPIGTNASYVPATIKNAGTADNFNIHVFSDVTDDGTSTGTTIGNIANAVNMTWIINEETAGGSDVSLSYNGMKVIREVVLIIRIVESGIILVVAGHLKKVLHQAD